MRIHGQYFSVLANVEQIQGFSAHADRRALIRWLSNLSSPPRHVFLTHGEKEAAKSLAMHIRHNEGWKVSIPEYLEEFEF